MTVVNNSGKLWVDLTMREKFELSWAQAGLPGSDMVAEYRFHPERKWRFDIAFPSRKVAVEFDGMGYGHQAAAALVKSNERQNVAVSMGWKVLRFSPAMFSLVRMPEHIDLVVESLMRSGDSVVFRVHNYRAEYNPLEREYSVGDVIDLGGDRGEAVITVVDREKNEIEWGFLTKT